MGAAAPTIRQLKYLIVLSETLNFLQASEKLFITQSTLSAGNLFICSMQSPINTLFLNFSMVITKIKFTCLSCEYNVDKMTIKY